MWNVPVDHEMFKEVNNAQWLWYFHNFMKDREEEFTRRRDLVEYHASFIEPEAVRKIREAREKAVEVPDEQFAAGLEKFFGRALSAERKDTGKIESVDPTAAISNFKTEKFLWDQKDTRDKKGKNYKHWLGSNLE